MLHRQQTVIRPARVAESGSPALHLDEPVRVAAAARGQRPRVAWLALWMAGAIASYIAAALAVRALAKSLSVFEMMSVRSAGGLVFLLALMAIRPNMRRGIASRRIGLHFARNSVQFA